MKSNRDFAITFHDTDLDVFRSCLYNFEKTFDRQLYAFFASHAIFVIFLKELADRFRRSTNCIGLQTRWAISVMYYTVENVLTFHAL